MTTARAVETSVTVNNDSPIQDYAHPDDQTQPTFEMAPGFKPISTIIFLLSSNNSQSFFSFFITNYIVLFSSARAEKVSVFYKK